MKVGTGQSKHQHGRISILDVVVMMKQRQTRQSKTCKTLNLNLSMKYYGQSKHQHRQISILDVVVMMIMMVNEPVD